MNSENASVETVSPCCEGVLFHCQPVPQIILTAHSEFVILCISLSFIYEVKFVFSATP
jgi:hypothetical protein